MANRVEGVLELEDVQIINRNFVGRETEYNPPGSRQFCAVLPNDELFESLKADLWNVKRSRPNDDYPEGRPFLPIAVNYDRRPPRIYQVTPKNKLLLPEDLVSGLDEANIISADLIIGPYNYEIRGEAGVKAYLRQGYFNIELSKFDEKYADIPDGSGGGSRSGDTPPWDEHQ